MSKIYRKYKPGRPIRASQSNTLSREAKSSEPESQPNINPDTLTHQDILHLQRTIGNNAVSRLLQRQSTTAVSLNTDRSSIQREDSKETLEEQVKSWDDIPKALMKGVLSETSSTAAAKRVYANMFTYALSNWTYQAGSPVSSGKGLIEGTISKGMCETYRNAFKYMLETYVVPLTENYAPFSDGFDIVEGQDLVRTKFVTKPDLALLGRESGYNVYKEIDASNGSVSDSKRYLFSSHWQLKVNGDTYDPLFQGIGKNDMAWEITNITGNYYRATDSDIAFQADPNAGPTDGGEFGGKYVMIRNADQFEALAQESEEIKYVHGLLKSMQKSLTDVKNEWSTVKDKKTGKAKWRRSIQKRFGPWKSMLEAIRTESQTVIDSDAKDDILAEMIRQASVSILTEIKYQAGSAKRALVRIEGDPTNMEAMGGEYDLAISALDTALDKPILKNL